LTRVTRCFFSRLKTSRSASSAKTKGLNCHEIETSLLQQTVLLGEHERTRVLLVR
jgi:hypothetical protein